MAPFCPLSVLSLLFFTTLLLSAAEPPPPIFLPLAHVLSKDANASVQPSRHLHFIKSASLRSAARLRHHQRLQQQPLVSLPLSPGSDYTLSFSVGSRGSHAVELYMDTGSDLVWFPCAPFECILCEGKPNYPPPPGSTHFPTTAPVPCYAPSCSAAHSSLPSSDLCAIAGCPLETIETSTCSSSACPPFYYAYGDGSIIARLRSDRLAIPAGSTTAKAVQLPNFTFGCAHTALAEPIGVAGFGRGILSLPAQFARLSPHLGKQFSYCLVSHSFETQKLHRPSPLILGRFDASLGTEEPFVFTPMIPNPKHPYFYSVGLDAVSVGRRRIAASPELGRVDRRGNGGLVVDSGTTFTMLPTSLHARITGELERHMSLSGRRRAPDAEAETGLSPCYHEHAAGNSRGSVAAGVPALALHFAGNATVALPEKNYFMGFTRGGKRVQCLMLMGNVGDGEEGSSGPAGTLGNFQQQGFEVVYDLEGRRVGFARRRCAALWDSLSRG